MGNMSYCRFRNTLTDLKDCFEHINDELEGDELSARNELVKICKDIIDELNN